MLIAQVIAPASKLAFARALRAETATSSLGALLGVSACDEDDLYAAIWALARKDAIENALATRQLADGTLVLYDVSSAAFEGRHCPLGAIGQPRDGVKGRRQIVCGLLCTSAGVPVAIEVFEGNTADPKTLAAQITKLKDRFGLTRVALVGDRGMLTSARIRDELRPAHLDWITALRAPQIKTLVRPTRCSCRCSMSRTCLRSPTRTTPASGWCAAATRPWPNNALANATTCGRHRKRAGPHRRGHPAGQTIAARAGHHRAASGKVINKFKMAKHFSITITEDSFTFTRNQHDIAAEAALDGIYVLRTNLPAHTLDHDDVVLRYKGLEDVERFFRALNSELDVRPIRHRLADRVRAHMFLRMLSYYISWHMKQALAPILFYDNDKPAAAAKRTDPVAPAERSMPRWPSRPQTHPRRPPGAQFHQPARRPGHHLRQPHPTRPRHAGVHHDHHTHPTAAPSLRTTRRLAPPRPDVVSTSNHPDRETPGQHPNPSTRRGTSDSVSFRQRLSIPQRRGIDFEGDSPLFVGWDWGSTAHDVTVIDSVGGRVHRMAIPHTEDGIGRAVATLADHGDPGQLPVRSDHSRVGRGPAVGRRAPSDPGAP